MIQANEAELLHHIMEMHSGSDRSWAILYQSLLPVVSALGAAAIVGFFTLRATGKQAKASLRGSVRNARATLQSAEAMAREQRDSRISEKRYRTAIELAATIEDVYQQEVKYAWDRYGFDQPSEGFDQYKITLFELTLTISSKYLIVGSLFPESRDAFQEMEEVHKELCRKHANYLHVSEKGLSADGNIVENIPEALKQIRSEAAEIFGKFTVLKKEIIEHIAESVRCMYEK